MKKQTIQSIEEVPQKQSGSQGEVLMQTKAIDRVVLEKTPEQYIMKRKGRGGLTLNYVETGYIISALNKAFNYMWSFEVKDKVVGKDQVYIQAELTAHITPEINIKKTQFGGSSIKKSNGEIIDIADDLKAATSDALKKCASLFGISQDIFWPKGQEIQEQEDEPTHQPSIKEEIYPITPEQNVDIRKLVHDKGVEDRLPAVLKSLGVEMIKDLSRAQADGMILKLKSLPDKTEIDLDKVDQALTAKSS